MKSKPTRFVGEFDGRRVSALPRDYEAIHDEILALEEAIEVTASGMDVDAKARCQSWANWGAPSADALSSAVADERISPTACLLLYFRERLARLNERANHPYFEKEGAQ
jgi:hypothetical protein